MENKARITVQSFINEIVKPTPKAYKAAWTEIIVNAMVNTVTK